MDASFYIFPAVWQSLVNFYLWSLSFFLLMYSVQDLLWYQCLLHKWVILFKYDDDYIDDADDDDDDADDDDDDADDDDYYYYIITKYLMFKQIYSDQWYNL